MKIYYFLCSFILFFISNIYAQNTSVYVSAHPDDWQLFMNPNAHKSVKTVNEKVVFIHTTAGDDGGGAGNDYYLAREEGSLRAIRFMSNTFGSGVGLGNNMNETTVNINGHSLKKFTYRNIVAYFLRLPDGNLGGGGYSSTGNESLKKIYKASIPSISAIDGSTTYSSIADLNTTIKSIITLEANLTGEIFFNVADTNISNNPGDHSDHIHSSLIFQDVAESMLRPVTINLYQDYTTNNSQPNVFGNDLLINAGTWGVTTSGLGDSFHNSTWDDQHNAWVDKQYYRTILSNGLDTDLDGIYDMDDDDDDNDGVLDIYEAGNSISLDSDSDNCYDVTEAGYTDGDNDGILGTSPVIVGANGLIVSDVNGPITNGYTEPNDLDSNTIYDFQEAGTVSSISNQPVNQDLIIGNVTFSVVSNASTYQWQKRKHHGDSWLNIVDGGDYAGATTSNLIITNTDLHRISFRYRVIVQNIGFACDATKISDIVKLIDPNDFDNDGVSDIVDNDDDNDGVLDIYEDGNDLNLDSDSDNCYDVTEAGFTDGDNDGILGTSPVVVNANGLIVSDTNGLITNGYTMPNDLDNNTIYDFQEAGIVSSISSQPVNQDLIIGNVTFSVIANATLYQWQESVDNGDNWSNIIDGGDYAGSTSSNLVITNTDLSRLLYSYRVNVQNIGFACDATTNSNIVKLIEANPPNVALFKPTSSSSFENGQLSSLAVDDVKSTSNYWAANPYSQWWQVDLQSIYNLNKVVVTNYYDGTRYYQYDFEGSLDGNSWFTIEDFNNNIVPATIEGNTFTLNNIEARFIRVNMNFNSANVGVHIVEFEAYGTLISAPTLSNSIENDPFTQNKGNIENYFLSVYPNPSNSGKKIKLDFYVSKNIGSEILIYDNKGVMIFNEKYNLFQGKNTIDISRSDLPTGLLIVSAKIGEKTENKKIIIK